MYTEKKENPDIEKHLQLVWKIARIGRGKQEIQREHNSNLLQRHEHVQL